MYKVVEEYIEKLENMREETFDKYSCVEYHSVAGNVPAKVAENDRNRATALLEDIFRQFSWSDEFVTAFCVFCNFYILTGMHLCLQEEFGLKSLYEMVDDEEDIEYLEYIRKGIYEQDIEMFLKAINMGIFDFSIPWLYTYIIFFEQLTLHKMKELHKEEERDNFIWAFNCMEEAKGHVSGELAKYMEIHRMPFNELDTILSDMYLMKYLPCIYVLDDVHMLASCAASDLGAMRKYGHREKIASVKDMVDGLKKASGREEDLSNYQIFSQELFHRIEFIEEITKDLDIRDMDFEDYERDDSILERRYFLKLPKKISPEGATYIDYARQLKLTMEKEKLIEKNRKMVEDYSHSIENIIKPSLIGEIADLLKQDEKYKEVYKKLIQIYFSEVITQNECRLLRMTHDFETSAGAIRETISRCKAKKAEGVKGLVSFYDLLYKAMNQMVLQIVDDKRTRMQFIRNKIAGAGLELHLLDQYLWSMNQDKGQALAFWEKLFHMDFLIEETLDDRYFREDEIGTTFLFTRMVELLTNLFTYSEYKSSKRAMFSIGLEGEEGERQYIVFKTSNVIGERKYSSGKNGLVSIAEMLSRINNYDPDKDEFVEYWEEEGIFHVKVYIEASLYI